MNVLLLVGVSLVSALVTRLVRELAKRKQLLDRPNARSAHSNPTPRLGGIGIMAGFLPALLVVVWRSGTPSTATVVAAATAAVSAIGLWDDLRSLTARTRLAAQALCATAVVVSASDRLASAWSLFGPSLPQPILIVLSVLWIVWVTNLYNFMDGIDGLAAGQAVIAGTAIAIVAARGGSPVVAAGAAALAAASLGFLAFNFPPASIFMGDVGSTAIGFFFASTPLLAEPGAVPVEAVGLALALFVLDATVTLLRRIARRERLSQAHRTHFYQRPLALGIGHRTITLTAYAGMLSVAGLALVYRTAEVGKQVSLIAGACAIFVALGAAVVGLESKASAKAGAQPDI